jgi:hypothetical protein
MAGGFGRNCEPCGPGMDLALAQPELCAMASARTQPEGEAVRAFASGAGDCDADSGWIGDMDTSDGASHGTAAALQDQR